jgi:hypothetical protein
MYQAMYQQIEEAGADAWADSDPYCWDRTPGVINFTPIEDWLWADIRQCGAVLYPQYPVLNFFVDFANPVAKVAIECDGHAYHLDKAKDAARDQRLTDSGWTVYRISGHNCKLECDEETGSPSLPLLFIKRICNLHGISRFVDTQSEMPLEDFRSSKDLDDWWKFTLRNREEAAARKRGEL